MIELSISAQSRQRYTNLEESGRILEQTVFLYASKALPLVVFMDVTKVVLLRNTFSQM